MALMIYDISRNGTREIGYDSDEESNSEKDDKLKTLHSHFVPSGKQNGVVPKGKTFSKPKAKVKAHSCFNYAYMYKYPAHELKFVKNSGKTNQKGPRKLWVPKDKIIYVADILSSAVETSIMVPGIWMLATDDGKKAYVPNPRT